MDEELVFGREEARHYEAWFETKEGRRVDEQEKALLRCLLASLGHPRTMLEVACGTGHFSRWFKDILGCQVRGIDSSLPMLEEARALRRGLYTARAAERRGRQALSRAAGLRLDYFAVRQAHSLARPGPYDRDLVLLAAARVGRTRLIDNVRVRLNFGR